MATSTTVTIEQYLVDASFHPDVEYVDGELRERPVVFSIHGKLQSLISIWFGQHEEWGLDVAVEVRTRVSPTRVRLPDVVVDTAGAWPQTLLTPPLIVIEILSPSDSYTETQRLARDYQDMGVPNIWLLDPEARTARICERDAWRERTRLEVAGTDIHLDVDQIYARLFRES